MSPPSIIRCVSTRTPRYLSTRRHASHEAPQWNEPTGWLWGEKPEQPSTAPQDEKARAEWAMNEQKKAESRQLDKIVNFTFTSMFGIMGLAAVLLYYKPDTSIQTWALQEAKTRMDARGEKYKYESSSS